MELNKQEEKKLLRKEIKSIKSNYSENEFLLKSEIIFNSFENLIFSTKYSHIMAYWSLADEVYTHQWIEQHYKQKNIFLPVIQDDEIKVKAFSGVENMQTVPPFGIKEPIGKEIKDLDQIEIILVPGMAFDRMGYRMGRGKGYYDRFLPKTSAIRIGICFDFQLFNQIPINEYDAKMDYIITEKEIITINKKEAVS